MAKQICLKDGLYEKIKKEKGEKSFSDFIKEMVTESVSERLKKIEDYLKRNSEGEFK